MASFLHNCLQVLHFLISKTPSQHSFFLYSSFDSSISCWYFSSLIFVIFNIFFIIYYLVVSFSSDMGIWSLGSSKLTGGMKEGNSWEINVNKEICSLCVIGYKINGALFIFLRVSLFRRSYSIASSFSNSFSVSANSSLSELSGKHQLLLVYSSLISYVSSISLDKLSDIYRCTITLLIRKSENMRYPYRMPTILIMIVHIILPLGVSGIIEHRISLQKFTYVDYVFNFELLIKNGIECYIKVQNNEFILFDDECLSQQDPQNYTRKLSINSYELETKEISIKFSSVNNSELMQKIYLKSIIVSQKIVVSDQIQTGLLIKEDINGYLLPFNLMNLKNPQIIVEASQLTLKRIKHTKEPFIQTYWNEYGKDMIIVNWLPYFSNCQHSTSNHLFLNKIIEPIYGESDKKCKDTFSLGGFREIECPNKQISMTCTLEKIVSNDSKSQWYENRKLIPFYLFRYPITRVQYQNYIDSTMDLQQVRNNYFQQLVPLEYEDDFDLWSQIPNQFTLKLQVALQQSLNGKYELMRACIIGKHNPDLFQVQNSEKNYSNLVKLDIEVKYLTFIEIILTLRGNIAYYVVEITLITVIGFLLIGFIGGKQRRRGLQTTRLLIFPTIKGFLLSFVKILLFILLLYYLASMTNYSTVSTNFDDNLQANNSQTLKYRGRVGFTLFIAGFLMLSSSIGQSFKILSSEDTKIILEDDEYEKSLMQNKKAQRDPFEEKNKERRDLQKRVFLQKNINSHRKHIFLFMFIFTFFIMLLFEYPPQKSLFESSLCYLLVYPLMQKFIVFIYRHYIIQEMLYLYAILIVFQGFTEFLIYGHYQHYDIIVYLANLIGFNCVVIWLQILGDLFAIRAQQYLKMCQSINKIGIVYRFLSSFKRQITGITTQSKYEKTIYYTAMISIPFVVTLNQCFMHCLQNIVIEYADFCKDLELSQRQFFNKSIVSLFTFLPLRILVLLWNIKLFQNKFKLGILKNLEFQLFRFSNRKTNLINDQFALNRNIQHFYREFEKFCQSSQMYMLTYHFVFCLNIIVISFLIIISARYIVYKDPALLVILIIVSVLSNFWEILWNFLVIKVKLYSRKQEYKMRAKLESIEKVLRKNDYKQYLQVQAVKDYFLIHCRKWIIENFSTIFDLNDLQANNYELLKKYKYYKNMIKKKKIQQKKLQHKVINSPDNTGLMDQPSQINKIKKLKSLQKKTNPDDLVTHNTVKPPNQNIVELPQKQFEALAKPIVYSWLYIAKQFVFLKGLVVHIKKQKQKSACEMCSINIELETIEKIEFREIINEYRILNVGRPFIESHFISFYKEKQDFITVCFDCKEKNLHLEKKAIELAGLPTIMMKKWLLIAKSRLLHFHQSKESHKAQGNSISKSGESV